MEPQTALVRIVIDPDLPAHMHPCHVVRTRGVTVVFMLPEVRPTVATQWSIDNLSPAERNYIRASLGEPPVGQRLSDWLMDREWAFIPMSLVVDMPGRDRAAEAAERARELRRRSLRIRSDIILRRAMGVTIVPLVALFYDPFAFTARTAF